MSAGGEMSSTTDDFAALRVSPKYSDLEIRCEDRVFKVHRAIVCTLSSVLAKECDGSFKESTTGVIEHTTFSASTVDMMLQFMYTRTYALTVADTNTTTIDVGDGVQSSDNAAEDAAADSDVVGPTGQNICRDETAAQLSELSLDSGTMLALAHIDVYAIADYYDMSALKTLAFQNVLSCQSRVKHTNFIHVVRAAYKSTAARDDCLRQSILQETIARANLLFKDERFMAAVSEEPELQNFTADVLPAFQNAVESSEAEKQARIESLEAVLAVVQDEADVARKKVATLQASNTAKDNALGEISHLTWKTTSCRNCGNSFGGHIDGVDDSYRACFLRCRDCKCKHFV